MLMASWIIAPDWHAVTPRPGKGASMKLDASLQTALSGMNNTLREINV